MDDLIAFMPLPLPEALGGGLRAVRSDRFAAILRPRSAPMICLLPRARLEDALIRQTALETLMQFGTVLPCAPDCVVTETEAARVLDTAAETLETLICALDGRAQYALRVEWDEPQVLVKFAKSPEIAPLFAMRPSPKQLTNAVDRLAERLRSEIAEQLAPVAEDLRDQPRAEGMVSHHSFLVAAEQSGALDDCLERIDAIWTEGFKLRLIGPSPATCHGLVRLERAAPKLVAQAAKRLGLSLDTVTSDQIAAQKRALLRGAGSLAGEADRIREAADLVERALAFEAGETVLWIERVDISTQALALRRAS